MSFGDDRDRSENEEVNEVLPVIVRIQEETSRINCYLKTVIVGGYHNYFQ